MKRLFALVLAAVCAGCTVQDGKLMLPHDSTAVTAFCLPTLYVHCFALAATGHLGRQPYAPKPGPYWVEHWLDRDYVVPCDEDIGCGP